MRRKFQLPMTLTNTVCPREDGKIVARSLDFHLASVGKDEAEAKGKLRIQIKEYVEFGLSRFWDDFVLHAAPDKYVHMLTPDTPIEIGPPIEIASNERAVITVRSPHNEACVAAVHAR
jgi:hypothetical protein